MASTTRWCRFRRCSTGLGLSSFRSSSSPAGNISFTVVSACSHRSSSGIAHSMHLRVSGLRKAYDGTDVVAGLDLALEPGVCFGLLGPNGAGKTTTLRLCLGLTEPDAGEITMLGFAVPDRAREARARIGVVPQTDNLDPDFTVRENLLVYGRYFGLRSRELEARIPDLLEFAELTARGESRIQALSGGMKRRLTLARALVNDPQLMFLDEPTTGLDPQARHLIWERLRR